MASKERTERGQFFRRRLDAARMGRAAMHATLRQGAAAPLTALRDENGVLTFEPLKVDSLARGAWAK
eukprot:2227435-Alexandrium_andersonii.AAC.1